VRANFSVAPIAVSRRDHLHFHLASGSTGTSEPPQPSIALSAISTTVLTRNMTAMPIIGPPFAAAAHLFVAMQNNIKAFWINVISAYRLHRKKRNSNSRSAHFVCKQAGGT
jgi:hypothetical protein